MSGALPNSMPTAGAVAVAPTADDITKLTAAFPLAMLSGGDPDEWAQAAGVPVAVAHAAMADPVALAGFMAAQRKAEHDGSLLKPVAGRLSLAMLRKLEDATAAGELDLTDISNLLPKVHKVVEHADRMAAARGSEYDGLATFHITFVNGGMQIAASPPPEVLDLEMVEIVRGELAPLEDAP